MAEMKLYSPHPPRMTNGRLPILSMTRTAGKVATNMVMPTTPEAKSETAVPPRPLWAQRNQWERNCGFTTFLYSQRRKDSRGIVCFRRDQLQLSCFTPRRGVLTRKCSQTMALCKEVPISVNVPVHPPGLVVLTRFHSFVGRTSSSRRWTCDGTWARW
jgi:hypothetical protein